MAGVSPVRPGGQSGSGYEARIGAPNQIQEPAVRDIISIQRYHCGEDRFEPVVQSTSGVGVDCLGRPTHARTSKARKRLNRSAFCNHADINKILFMRQFQHRVGRQPLPP
jgi:hypothetical protein